MRLSRKAVASALKDLAVILWPPTTVMTLHILRQVVLPETHQLDMVMHFLGGLTIAWAATTAYSLLRARGYASELKLVEFGIALVAVTALVGVLWEFMESLFFRDVLLRLEVNLYTDTISDLALDTLGAIVWTAVTAFRRRN